jgi:mono/diheme cytochrome c family protein
MSSLEDREIGLLKLLEAEPAHEIADQNREIFVEMLATAITNKGDIKDIQYLLALADRQQEPQKAWLTNALVHGILNASEARDSTGIALPAKPAILRHEVPVPGMDASLLVQLESKFRWPGKPRVVKQAGAKEQDLDAAVLANGRQQFLNLCASCHGTQGEGMRRFAPPLHQSEWVNGEDYKLAMILLHGMEGPVSVNGKVYDIPDILPNMPSFSTLQDKDIAAVATYIRNSWGHSNTPVSARMVGGIRFRTQGKIKPWTAAELDTVTFDVK